MAIIKLSATVERIFQDGRCVKLVEKNESGGKEYTARYTAWFEQSPGLSDGDRVNVSGFLSVKQGKPWTDRDNNERTSIDVSINRARIDAGEATSAPSAAQNAVRAQEPEPWATGTFNDETPF